MATNHGDIAAGSNIHTPITWEYADSSARTGATGLTADDVGKFARQTDNNTVWMLTAATPTWTQVGGIIAADVDFDGYDTIDLGTLNFDASTELTISGGIVTATQTLHSIDTEGDAATDNLDTINGGTIGDILIIRAENSARTVVVRHNVGNILTYDATDVSIDSANKILYLVYGSDSKWRASAGGQNTRTKSLTISNSALGKGAVAPTQVIVGNYIVWEFTINDDAVFNAHIPEDWASGTALSVHVDWQVNEAYATAPNGEVRWQLAYSATPHDNTESIAAPTHSGTLDSGDINIPATARYLTYTDFTIPGANLSSEDELGLTLKRIALVGGNNPTAEPGVTMVHIEYTANT